MRVMGERKRMWRSWTVREGEDAIIERRRSAKVNVTFGVDVEDQFLAGGEGDGIRGGGC